MFLEVPVFNTESAIACATWGVNRLELCADLHAGGTTPTTTFFNLVRKKTNLPLFVMLRPRGGNFIYTQSEKEQLEEELLHFKSLSADGLVFWALNDKNQVDTDFCKLLIKQAGDIPCTFHRAFDLVTNQQQALEQLIELGFQRVLTSGGAPDVASGLPQLTKLMKQAQNRIVVMPSGGLKKTHLPVLHQTGYLKEIHAGCKTEVTSKISYSNGVTAFFGHQTRVDKDCVLAFLAF